MVNGQKTMQEWPFTCGDAVVKPWSKAVDIGKPHNDAPVHNSANAVSVAGPSGFLDGQRHRSVKKCLEFFDTQRVYSFNFNTRYEFFVSKSPKTWQNLECENIRGDAFICTYMNTGIRMIHDTCSRCQVLIAWGRFRCWYLILYYSFKITTYRQTHFLARFVHNMCNKLEKRIVL